MAFCLLKLNFKTDLLVLGKSHSDGSTYQSLGLKKDFTAVMTHTTASIPPHIAQPKLKLYCCHKALQKTNITLQSVAANETGAWCKLG